MMNTYLLLLPNMPDGSNATWVPLPTDGNDYAVKVDHQLSQSHRLSFRFYRNDANQSNIPADTALGAGLQRTSTNLVQTENFKYTAIFSPRLLNEFTFSHLYIDSKFVMGAGNKNPKDLGGNFNVDGPIPQVPTATVAGRFSVSGAFPYDSPVPTYEVRDKLTWMHGRHSLTAGGSFERGQRGAINQFGASGYFTFDGSFTGNALADFLIGRSSSLFTRGKIDNYVRGYKYHFFAQDDIKVNPRLTLNLGLRYELDPPWFETLGASGDVWPGHQSQKFPNAPPGLVYPGDPGVTRGIIPTDKNNFAPRIGLAWDPTGRGQTAIRAAFGFFTNTVGTIMSNSPNQIAPWLVSISSVPHSFSDPYDVAGGGIDPFPYTVNLQNPTFYYPMQGFSIDHSYRDGYIEQWNFNIQHQIGSVLVKAGYYGNVGHKLSNMREGNQAVFAPGATPANAQTRRPYFPQYYGDIAVTNSDANSNYHSLQVGAEKKFSRGYTLQLAYTFSKSIDIGSNSQADAVTCQDANNCRGGERGLSDFDQRHILAVNGIWELPFMKGNRVLGGWQVAGLTRIASGTPFSAFSGIDRAAVGSGRGQAAQRLDLTGNWRLDPNRSHGELAAAYFDKSAFALPPLGEFGDSGRNIIIGPGYSQTDVSLQKRFRLPGERGGIEFRADFFNLFNQVNFNRPNNTFVSPAFGRIQSARDARIVQLALRYDF
ncbi:MAG: TonB-dependent receptor [Acidobacteria bacterium]|nr:TonB-dependent receptor [Acidobacteriota bacterium]